MSGRCGPPAHHHATVADIEDLEAGGFIAVEWGMGRDGRRGRARLTPAGERQADLVRSPPPPPIDAVSSQWPTDILPVLHAAYDIECTLTPGAGVTQDALNAALGRRSADPATATALMQLSAAAYLRNEQRVDQVDGPILFRLGEKALQQVARWPGGANDLAAALLALIDERLNDPDVLEDERHRLVQLRDAVTDVGKGVVTALIAGVIKAHTGV